jgi:1,4-alpha-glucan branching enzyme
MNYSPEATRFSLWAPTATEVKVLLYEAGKGGSAYRMVSMEAGEKGMWSVTVEGDLKGKFYAFNVRVGEYGIHVYSKEGIGTDVIVELPLVCDGDRQGGWR